MWYVLHWTQRILNENKKQMKKLKNYFNKKLDK